MTNVPAHKWPVLPLADWRATYATIHMWSQIVGKTRLALASMENHWWQVALYVTARGLTTSAMPCGNRSVEVQLDFISHQLLIQVSDGSRRSFALTSMSVAEFFTRYMGALHELGIDPAIYASPVEVVTAIPFAQDREHATYHAHAAQQCWLVLLSTQRVLKAFRGTFLGKQSPVHFFWGSFDLAATRFSGRPAPRHPGGIPHCPDWVMEEAYRDEVSSAGYWPGGADEGGFYSYGYPAPGGFAAHPIVPNAAYYDERLGEFVLPYAEVRKAADPDTYLTEFLESTFRAARALAGWPDGR